MSPISVRRSPTGGGALHPGRRRPRRARRPLAAARRNPRAGAHRRARPALGRPRPAGRLAPSRSPRSGRRLDEAPIAWLDGATGEHVADGGAEVQRHGDRWELSVGPPPAAASLRLVDGVVAAGALQVTGAVPVTDESPLPREAVIDGIPAEILGAERPAATRRRSPSLRPRPALRLCQPRTAITTTTRRRRSTPGPRRPQPSPDHLEQSTYETVLAVRCPPGHLTAGCPRCAGSAATRCRRRSRSGCLRPRLGVLRLPDGDGRPSRPAGGPRPPARAVRPRRLAAPGPAAARLDVPLADATCESSSTAGRCSPRTSASRGGTTLLRARPRPREDPRPRAPPARGRHHARPGRRSTRSSTWRPRPRGG